MNHFDITNPKTDAVISLSFLQYTLSQETIEALKKPTFDVWHWEHNEVSSLEIHLSSDIYHNSIQAYIITLL